MPLRLVRSPSNRVLWDTCVDRFLQEVGDNPGPRGHASHLWLTHRNLRDALLEEAHRRGSRGWLAPPVSFFSELPDRLGVTGRPLGLLVRRRLVAELADQEARQAGITAARGQGIIRGHMMDSLLSDLLPEGTTPEELERALDTVAGDDFARRRNRWVASVYRRYLEELGEERFDPRSLHAMLAGAIERGALPDALGDARRLHVYGIYTLRSRRRLVKSLARQNDVEVHLYAPREAESGEWDELAVSLELEVEDLGDGPATDIRVQPAPDSIREFRWIAAEVKRRIAEEGIEPHEIAIISRTGRDDTRRASAALRAAGIPFSARQRMPLCDLGALKAVLELFRGAAAGWTYRTLRNVLTSPYFDTAGDAGGEDGERRRIDLRGIDFVATQRRVAGLEAWADELDRVARAKEEGTDRDVRRANVWPDRLRADAGRLRALGQTLTPLAEARPERDWVELTLDMVREGILGLRRRACSVVGDRWEIVRYDQRGLRQLESLLSEWSELVSPGAGGARDALSVAEWHRLLERLLEAHELALSTPRQKGVQVLEAHDAALTPFRAVFVAHANDREFPQAFSSRGVLLEEELSRLRDAGLPVTDRELGMRRERTLWRAVAQGGGVTVSYRTTNAEGTPLLPSLMVPEHDEATELPRTFEPIGDRPVSVEEALRAAAVQLRASAEEGSVVVAPESFPLRRAVMAAHGETMRGVRDATGEHVMRPNPWHGELRDPAVLDRLASLYGPDHVWSASQLEAYATCPFVFLTERVLRITDADEADEDTSPMTFGGVAHDILEQFYDELIRTGLPTSFAPVEGLFERIAEDVLRQREENGEWLGSPVLWRFTREEVKRTVREYLDWEVEYIASKGERPVWCELELKDGEGDPVDIAGPDLSGAMQAMRFTGRVDRVDNAGTDDSPVYRILDYKSSNVPGATGYKDGALLQAPLYMLALERVKGTVGERGRYRVIKKPDDPKNGAEVGGGGKVGRENYERALQYGFSIPDRVRTGLFEPVVAASRKWAFYHPGIEVTRTRAQLPKAPKGEDPVAWSRFSE